MPFYYCKNVEDLGQVLTVTDIVAGSTLDKLQNVLADRIVVEQRMRTAQTELEQLLCSRFDLDPIRASNSEFLRYAHAVITWWHLEAMGKGRDLVRQKYEDLMSFESPLCLARMTTIIAADGTRIDSGIKLEADMTPVKRKKSFIGKRIVF